MDNRPFEPVACPAYSLPFFIFSLSTQLPGDSSGHQIPKLIKVRSKEKAGRVWGKGMT